VDLSRVAGQGGKARGNGKFLETKPGDGIAYRMST
jgi:hypothetical protein